MENKRVGNKTILVYLVFMTLSLLIDISYMASQGVYGITLVLSGFISAFTLMAYLTSIDRPVMSVGFVTLAQIISVINMLISGYSIGDAMLSMGLTFILSLIALGVIVKMTHKKLSGTDKEEKNKVSVLDIICYNRKAFKVKWWAQIIIFSLILTLIGYISKSNEVIVGLVGYSGYGMLVATSMVIPSLLTISILTTSVMTMELYVIYTALEVITVYLLFEPSGSSLTGYQVLTALLDLAVAVYIVVRFRKVNTEKVEPSNVKESETDSDKRLHSWSK